MIGAAPAGRRSTLPAWWVCAALLAGWGVLLTMVRTGKGLAEDDVPVLGWVVGHRTGTLTGVLADVSNTGLDGAAALLGAGIAGLVAARSRSLRPLVTLGAAVAGAVVVAELVKVVLPRARPATAVMLGAPETGSSFPSAHTLVSTALAGAVALVVWRATSATSLRVAAVVTAAGASAAMGISRVYLGDHWPTDVLASYVLAGAVVAAVLALTARAATSVQADQVVSGGRT